MLTVYSITSCPWCDKAKRYLKQKGVSYEERNIELNAADAAACEKLSGDTMVPVITNGTDYVVGFDREKIDALIQ